MELENKNMSVLLSTRMITDAVSETRHIFYSHAIVCSGDQHVNKKGRAGAHAQMRVCYCTLYFPRLEGDRMDNLATRDQKILA
jgi:hypothetical protein